MVEINLPTAAKQDSIKQTVESIANNFPLEISGGTDWSEYTPFFHKIEVDNTSELKDFISILGEGYISAIYVEIGSVSSNPIVIEVRCDEALIINMNNGTANSATSSLNLSTLIKDSEIAAPTNINFIFPYENTDYQVGGLKISGALAQPIFFNESFVVKAAGNTSGKRRLRIVGGLKNV